MYKETQKVVPAVMFGCVVGIPSTLLLRNKFDLTLLLTILLGIIFMIVSTILYDPKETWAIVTGTWKDTCTWGANKTWWKLLKIKSQGLGASMLAFGVCFFIILGVSGFTITWLIPTINSTLVLVTIVSAVLVGGLCGFIIIISMEMDSPLLDETAMKEAIDDRNSSYARARRILISPVSLAKRALIIIISVPKWWHNSGKTFIYKVFKKLATAGRKVTFFCTGIGFATGVFYGLVAGIEYLAPTLIGTATGVTIAILLIEIIPIRILKIPIR